MLDIVGAKCYPRGMFNELKRQFAKDGYIILRDFFNASEVQKLKDAWQELYADVANIPQVDSETFNIAEMGGLYKKGFYVYGELPGVIGSLYKHPKLVEIAQSFYGHNVALYINRLNVKDTKWRAFTPLHQDLPYFNGGPDKLNIFIPLAPANLETSNVGLVKKSQDYGLLDRGVIDISEHPELEVITPTLNVGDVVVNDILLWHHSPTYTKKDGARPILQIVYQPSSDGSYYPQCLREPTLVCGEWQTNQFDMWKPLGPIKHDYVHAAKPQAKKP